MDRLNRSRNLYLAGQLETALSSIRELCAEDPHNADAWWLLGCVTRHLGLVAVSDDAFRTAAELLPKQMPMPHRVTLEDFRTLAQEAKGILAESGSAAPSLSQKMTPQEPLILEAATAIFNGSASARRWGIAVPGHPAAARLETAIMYLPSRDVIGEGLSPDAQWSREASRVVLYQANHENAGGSDRDLVHCLVRNLVFASKAAPARFSGSA